MAHRPHHMPEDYQIARRAKNSVARQSATLVQATFVQLTWQADPVCWFAAHGARSMAS